MHLLPVRRAPGERRGVDAWIATARATSGGSGRSRSLIAPAWIEHGIAQRVYRWVARESTLLPVAPATFLPGAVRNFTGRDGRADHGVLHRGHHDRCGNGVGPRVGVHVDCIGVSLGMSGKWIVPGATLREAGLATPARLTLGWFLAWPGLDGREFFGNRAAEAQTCSRRGVDRGGRETGARRIALVWVFTHALARR